MKQVRKACQRLAFFLSLSKTCANKLYIFRQCTYIVYILLNFAHYCVIYNGIVLYEFLWKINLPNPGVCPGAPNSPVPVGLLAPNKLGWPKPVADVTGVAPNAGLLAPNKLVPWNNHNIWNIIFSVDINIFYAHTFLLEIYSMI